MAGDCFTRGGHPTSAMLDDQSFYVWMGQAGSCLIRDGGPKLQPPYGAFPWRAHFEMGSTPSQAAGLAIAGGWR